MTINRRHWLGVAIVSGLAALLLGPQGPLGGFWGADGEDPTGGALAALIAYGVVEAAAFGFGVGFLVFGWPMLRQLGAGDRLTGVTFAAIGWALVSWWPHGSFHQAIEENKLRRARGDRVGVPRDDARLRRGDRDVLLAGTQWSGRRDSAAGSGVGRSGRRL